MKKNEKKYVSLSKQTDKIKATVLELKLAFVVVKETLAWVWIKVEGKQLT